MHLGTSVTIGNHDDLATCAEYSDETCKIMLAYVSPLLGSHFALSIYFTFARFSFYSCCLHSNHLSCLQYINIHFCFG